MKNVTATRILSMISLAVLSFIVLFDPTEMALGAEFFTLSPWAISLAEILGNVVWVVGVLYILISILFVTMLVSGDQDVIKHIIVKAIDNGTISVYAPSLLKTISVTISVIMSILAIGSGFWFTGLCWLIVIIVCRLLIISIRNHSEYTQVL